jgi:carbon storage regulator CsrA
MLILSRKSQEAVVVGGLENVEPLLTVTVLEIKGRQVRLGFNAHNAIAIHRLEVWERIQARGPPYPTDSSSPAAKG